MPIVASQPFAINAPVAAVWERSDEKGCSREHYSHQYADLHDTESRRCRCKRKRARLILLSIAFVFCAIVSLVGALGLWDATFNDSSWLKEALGLTVDGGENSWTALSDLMKRQSNGTTGSNTFVNHKCQCPHNHFTVHLPLTCVFPSRLLDHHFRRTFPRGACRNLPECLVLPRWAF